jgi:hypothetical protein
LLLTVGEAPLCIREEKDRVAANAIVLFGLAPLGGLEQLHELGEIGNLADQPDPV